MGNKLGGGEVGGGVDIDAYTTLIKDSAAQVLAMGVEDAADLAKDALGVAGVQAKRGGTCCTGSSPTVGGYKALVDYSNSIFSQEKENLIRGIAADVSSILKVKSDFAKTAPIDKVVERLQAIVPDPRKGKNFIKDSAIQDKVCKAFAESINKRYGSKVIDENASSAVICRSIGEIMFSLFTGLHTEFLSVSADIGKIVTNLRALREYVDASNKRLRDLVAESGTQAQKTQADNVYDIYEKLRGEIDRQLAILANIVNATTSPLGKNLVSLIENNNEFKGLIQDLRVSTGSEAFGDKLGYLLSGVSSVSHAALIIDKALKTLGMTVSDYKNTKNLVDFREKVYKHLSETSPSSAELRKMLEAADIIYRTDYDHDNIVKYLESNMNKAKGGGSNFLDDGKYDLEEETERELGLSRGYMSRKSLGLQMKEHRHYRQLLFKDLKKLLNHNFQRIVDSVNSITRQIGNEIPISDDLYKFVVRFGQLESPDRENLHMALSGYRKDITSKHVKTTFMASLRAIHASLEPLKSGPQGAKFKEIQDLVAALIKSIDDFSDKFVKSLTEIPLDITKTARGGYEYDASYVPGSALGGSLFSEAALSGRGGAEEELDEVFGAGSGFDDFDYFTSMNKVQKELNYYYSIANLKSNLGKSAAELESYGQDYENILGDEIASLVDQINADFNREIELADYDEYKRLITNAARNKGTDTNRLREFAEAESLGFLLQEAELDPKSVFSKNPKMASELAGTFKYVRTYQKNAKINLLKAAEALDVYMKNFTAAVVAHPDDIKELSAMLGQITIVAKWFTNRTGDHLAALFESWPSDIQNNNVMWSTGQTTHPGESIYQELTSGSTPHYYEWVKSHKQHGLGNPSIPWYPLNGRNEVRDTFRRIEKSYAGMRALENLISTFSRIGDKFGDKSIKNSSFMSHAQMYKAISDYLVASSISMGATGASLANAGLMEIVRELNAVEVDEQGMPVSPAATPKGRSWRSKGLSLLAAVASVGALAAFVCFVYGMRQNHISPRQVPRSWKNPLDLGRDAVDTLATNPGRVAAGVFVACLAIAYAVRRGSSVAGGSATDEAQKVMGMLKSGNLEGVQSMVLNLAIQNAGVLSDLTSPADVAEVFGNSPQVARYAGKQITLLESLKILGELTKNGAMPTDVMQSYSNYLLRMVEPVLATLEDSPQKSTMVRAVRTLKVALRSPSALGPGGAGSAIMGGAWNVENVRRNYDGIKEPNESSATADVLDRVALTLRSVDDAGYNDDFGDTDHIFQLMMKSMVCKILTVVGIYTVFNRPGAINRSITPLRMILGAGEHGGSARDEPVVIDDAVELYIRLPLLAEWYREKFGFKKTGDVSSDYMVSMVPNFDGIWSDFVRIIFVETDYVRDGSYTDINIKKLIVVINEIYKKYKAKFPKSTVREVINAFVTEINRRYGFVKKNEINDYFEETRQHLASPGDNPYPNDDRVDYDILDVDSDYGRRPAPSDRFQKIAPGSRRAHRFAEKEQLMLAAMQFREKVESEMMEFSANFNKNLQDRSLSDNKYSFVENIIQVTQKLHNAKNSDERYEIVRDTIQGVNKYSGVSYEKTLLFNEVVVAPITVLSSIYELLNKFCSFAHGSNTWLLGKMAGRLTEKTHTEVVFSDDLANPMSFASLLRKEVLAKYPNIQSDRCDRFVKEMWKYVDMPSNYLDVGENGNDVALTKGVAFKQSRWDQINMHAWRRFGLNRKALMKDLLNAVFHIGCDLNNLVEARVSASGAPVVDYSKLQDLTVMLYNQVKSAIGEFRTVMSRETIARYESSSETATYTGSLLWLDENLIELLFNNRDKAGLPEVNESIAASWTDLTRPWNFDASSFTNPVALPNGRLNKDTFNDVLSELIYWNHKTDADGDTRVNPEYNAFPAMYMPYFKSGAFEPSTHEEKLAYAQLSRIPSVSPEVLKAEATYHTRKFKKMMEIAPWAIIKAKFTKASINENPMAPIQQKQSSGNSALDTILKAGNKMLSRSMSIAHMMNSFVRWFISSGYTTPTFNPELGLAGHNIYRTGRLKDYRGVSASVNAISSILAKLPNNITPAPYAHNDHGSHRTINFQAVINMLGFVPGLDRTPAYIPQQPQGQQGQQDELERLRAARRAATTEANRAGLALRGAEAAAEAEAAAPAAGAAAAAPGPAALALVNAQQAYERAMDAVNAATEAVNAQEQGLLKPWSTALAGAGFNMLLAPLQDVLNLDTSSLFPSANVSLSQVHMFGLLMFGISATSEFEEYQSNIYIVKLHAVAKRIVDWLLQGISSSNIDGLTTYQARDHDNRCNSLAMFMEWQKEINNILVDYMTEMSKIDLNLNKALAISQQYRDMRMVNSYMNWYMREPTKVDTWGTTHTGLIPVFNELLARYVVGFGDKSQYARIYTPLIESFANGANSREIMQGDGIKDINFSPEFVAAHSGGKGVKGDPPSNTLLYASLGRVIKSILTRTTPVMPSKYHSIANFIEVPEFVKESMRANLPVLDKEFEYISRKARFLKSVIEAGHDTEAGGVSVRRTVNPAMRGAIDKLIDDYRPEPGLHGGMIPPSDQSHDERRPYLVSLINSIVSGCNAIQRCTEIVQKELADIPLYGETFEGSLKQFRAKYNTNPLTPTSSLTFLLNSGSRHDNWLTPAFSVGSAKFKNLYSTRLVLAQSKTEPRLDYMPGMRDISHKYNAVSDKSTQAPQYYDTILQQFVHLMRYITDIGYHKDITGRFLEYTITGGEGAHPAQYSFGTMERVISTFENNDVKRAATDITFTIAESEGDRGEDRKTLRIYNILDLNIVPINIHAMQREVPLIHLYNYAYTFDRMIQESMIPDWKLMTSKTKKIRLVIRPDSSVSTAKGMLAKCMIFPHGPRTQEEYSGHIRRLMMGSTGLNIGRPKYLSDQLWGKVLLQDLFPHGDGDSNTFDEAGPAHELSLLRGQNSGQNASASEKLSYQLYNASPVADNRSKIRTVALDKGDIESMSQLGLTRYNTHVIRNQEWFTNLQLYVRFLMRESLKWLDTPVVTGHNVLSANVTSYMENENYSISDFQ